MTRRLLLALACAAAAIAFAWLATAEKPISVPPLWEKVAEGIYVTKSAPRTYAVIDRDRALVIDATVAPAALDELGVKTIEAVLLTHHHRDGVSHAAEYIEMRIPVRAPKESAEWLSPASVARVWKDSLPLRTSRTAYFVVPVGIEGIDFSIADDAKFTLGRWQLTAIATPGHSRDHFAYLCQANDGGASASKYLFCGDAFARPGKLWTPFTTDWDHWTDIGLKPTAASLRKMARLEPTLLCPAHGEIIDNNASEILVETAKAVDEAAFQKSFERFTKERLGAAPKYDFLAPKEQVASAGDKPWARLSDHLWITGNTYVLKSTTGDGILVLDPWGQRSADQVQKLRKDQKLGQVEVIGFSHAHYDHFDGIYVLDGRDRCQVWALDQVAIPLKDPFQVRAPFLDARPIKFTREFRDGETAAWGGYTFRFHHLPGQSWFTSGIEASIDGRRCMFTADNFFHQDQFSGTGGWMGLNRSSPAVYGKSAKKVLEIAPEWVLAEHGGPYVFSAEDYRRRVKWGESAGKAADALCISGNHLRDWTPHRVTVEPVLQHVKAGSVVRLSIAVEGSGRPDDVTRVTLRGRNVSADWALRFEAKEGRQVQEVRLGVPLSQAPGLYVFAAEVSDALGTETADPYFALVVEAP